MPEMAKPYCKIFPGNKNGKAAPASHKGINHTYKLKL